VRGRIFINYRRGGDPGVAQALLSRLEQAFPPDQLFMDVDNIEPGLDFVQVLEEQVRSCDVVLAVIGHDWIDARDPTGARRLDNPEDFVRVEILSALSQNKRVIPVLVGDTQMPRSDELPEAMKPLARRHAVRLTHERFRADTEGLIKALRRALEDADDARKAQTRQAEPEKPAQREKAPAQQSKTEQRNQKDATEDEGVAVARGRGGATPVSSTTIQSLFDIFRGPSPAQPPPLAPTRKPTVAPTASAASSPALGASWKMLAVVIPLILAGLSSFVSFLGFSFKSQNVGGYGLLGAFGFGILFAIAFGIASPKDREIGAALRRFFYGPRAN
jgi:TIR domain-containing protein